MSGVMVRILLFKDADPDSVKNALSELKATEIETSDQRKYGGNYKIQFVLPDRDAINEIARIEEVRWIEEVPDTDDDNGNSAGVMQSGAVGVTPVWDIGIHGEGQTISVMEGSDADVNHCMFQDPVNPVGATHRKVGFAAGASGRHATFVAGIAAGDDLNNPGTGANRGNAWASRLIFVRGRSWMNMFTQLTTSAANGAFIHTNSWHGINVNAANQAIYDITHNEVDDFIWNNEDHLVFGSMGNNGEEQGPPGTAKNAVGINAGTVAPNIMNVGDGNAGPTAGGRRKPDVVAPGCAITSAQRNTACTITTAQNIYGTANPICATSWATPAAAAAATLIRQYYVDGYYPTGSANPSNKFTPTGALIKASLINSAVDMTNIAGYPSTTEGWGLVRIDNALLFTGDDHGLQVWDVRKANGLTTLKVTLVWSDPPATAGTLNPAVNNLNLRVISPNGSQTFLGNRFVGGASATGGTADNINNVEQVMVNSPAIGTWQVVVDAASVNVAPAQGYAVVATAGSATVAPVLPQWYVGFGFGLTNTEIDALDTLTPGGRDTDDSDTSLKVYGGRRYSPNFALEFGIIDLGDYSQEDPTNSRVSFDAMALYAELVARFEVHTNWHFFGKLGMAYWDADMRYTNFSVSDSGSDNGLDPKIGLGFEYDFPNNPLLLRFEWEQYQNVGEGTKAQLVPGTTNLELNGQDINSLGLSLQYQF